jgi:hypothetical protein
MRTHLGGSFLENRQYLLFELLFAPLHSQLILTNAECSVEELNPKAKGEVHDERN